MTEVTTVSVHIGSLATLRAAAEVAPTPMLWLLDRSATPAADALSVLARHAPGPVAGLAVDDAGRPLLALLGRTTEEDAPGILEAARRHRLPLRHTDVTSLLVARELVLALAPPDDARFGRYAGREWTSRLFALQRGWLVPDSRVTVSAAPPAGSALHALRAARRGRWRAGETLREIHRAVVGNAT